MGLTAFGGPAAHIAMMEDEVVEKRKWMTREHFLDLVGATNLIPGPNSTEMTMHCGHERGGFWGLIIAGVSFLVPATILTGLLAWAYVEYGELPEVAPFVVGVKPIVLALIAGAVFKLGKKALKNWELGILGAMVILASLFGLNEIVALLLGGLLGALYFSIKNRTGQMRKLVLPLIPMTGGSVVAKLGTAGIFWSFLKVGAILYGSGYVLFAYLDAELVSAGWLTRTELMDAIAVGQFTPGPVLSTATFIGYQLGGLTGAMAATIGIFLPSFCFVMLLNPLVGRMRKSKVLGYFLDSVNIAAVAIMLAVLVSMTQESITDWKSLLIALLGFFFTFGPKKLSAVWLVILGGVMGYVLYLI